MTALNNHQMCLKIGGKKILKKINRPTKERAFGTRYMECIIRSPFMAQPTLSKISKGTHAAFKCLAPWSTLDKHSRFLLIQRPEISLPYSAAEEIADGAVREDKRKMSSNFMPL